MEPRASLGAALAISSLRARKTHRPGGPHVAHPTGGARAAIGTLGPLVSAQAVLPAGTAGARRALVAGASGVALGPHEALGPLCAGLTLLSHLHVDVHGDVGRLLVIELQLKLGGVLHLSPDLADRSINVGNTHAGAPTAGSKEGVLANLREHRGSEGLEVLGVLLAVALAVGIVVDAVIASTRGAVAAELLVVLVGQGVVVAHLLAHIRLHLLKLLSLLAQPPDAHKSIDRHVVADAVVQHRPEAEQR
mmetsp:Transcript_23242/g.45104  ORF Transcript_23242/g.45104 Transcript_23242/m.45104 type:complete len:249 (-) Transcript_23242:120-866(-)